MHRRSLTTVRVSNSASFVRCYTAGLFTCLLRGDQTSHLIPPFRGVLRPLWGGGGGGCHDHFGLRVATWCFRALLFLAPVLPWHGFCWHLCCLSVITHDGAPFVCQTPSCSGIVSRFADPNHFAFRKMSAAVLSHGRHMSKGAELTGIPMARRFSHSLRPYIKEKKEHVRVHRRIHMENHEKINCRNI